MQCVNDNKQLHVTGSEILLTSLWSCLCCFRHQSDRRLMGYRTNKFFFGLINSRTRVNSDLSRWTHEVGRWMLDNNVLILFRRNRFWHSSSSLIRARIYECIWDWYEVIDDVVNATRWRLLNDVDILITYSIVILRRPSTSVLCVHNYVTTAESLQPVCNRR